MKTDSLFYLLFQSAPAIFFDLISQSAAAAIGYRFGSVELKQTAFRIDGVFLPPEGVVDQPVYFVEVQFQKDEQLYRRLFAEIFLFLQQHPKITRWQAVVLYPRASVEPDEQTPYQSLLASGQCQRVYLDTLVGTESLTVGVGLVRLVVEPKKSAATLARRLIEQAQVERLSELSSEQIIEGTSKNRFTDSQNP